ncbi:hypothetical protein X566_21770 [Afipia sp. P52-10]|jgi:hypothetical protein|nr:hypothetical protein [Afipia sp. P52-10]ETR75348.1 hypothetical protein X566_21770 [Afipia sp. P52-10]
MSSSRSDSHKPASSSLEAAVALARNGFACLFSTSDEYEAALIKQRRAEGRYRKPSRWPMVAFWVFALAMASAVLFDMIATL